MRRGRPNDRRPPVTLASVLAKRTGQLRCRDCRVYCPKDNAIRESRGRYRCPQCGGWLDRENTNEQG